MTGCDALHTRLIQISMVFVHDCDLSLSWASGRLLCSPSNCHQLYNTKGLSATLHSLQQKAPSLRGS